MNASTQSVHILTIQR